MRHPIVLTTLEEDFRKIGLLPETDDPTRPRDIPSPDPSTLAGLDDSEGDDEAHLPGAKQPKPAMGPDDDDAEEAGMDPVDDGGSLGAQKQKSGYKKVAAGKEASLEGKDYKGYKASGRQPMMANKKNKGEPVEIASGLPKTDKIGGMKEEARKAKNAKAMKESKTLDRANVLLEEVSGLIRGVKTDEAVDEMLRSFRLVAENAALLSDRLTEISDKFDVENVTSQMEELSSDAVEMIDIIENELEMAGDSSEEDEAIKNSTDVHESSGKTAKDSDVDPDEPYDIPSPAFKEQTEAVLNAMVHKLMDALEGYDGALEEMGMSGMGSMMGGEVDEDAADGDPDDHEVHLHTKAKKVHIHHGQDDDGDDDGEEMSHEEPDGDEDGSYDDGDGDEPAGDEEMDDGDGGEGEGDEDDHESNSLMARMRALKARRSAMHGGKSFHGDDEEDESAY